MTGRKAVEELAKKRGVVLAAPAGTPAPVATAAPPPRSDGFLARVMPNAADLMADMKQQLGPFYAPALANLQKGAGYLVDEATGLAIGHPPLDEWERGKVADRDGWTVVRVRRK